MTDGEINTAEAMKNEKCRAKGLQLIATRVTDSNKMEVTEL